MHLAIWNIRGFNKSSKHVTVKQFIHEYKLSLLALLETKVDEVKLQKIANKIVRNWKWTSNVGTTNNARIWILWDEDILSVQCIEKPEQYMTCDMKSKEGKLSCLVTIVYALNQMEGRKNLWEKLLIFKRRVNCPWLLLYIKTIGCYFSWCNKQEAYARVCSKIDKVLVNEDWIHQYTTSQVEFLMPLCSDHSPDLVTIGEDNFDGKKPFKFFSMWAKHPDYLQLAFMHISEQVSSAKSELLDVQMQLNSDLFNPALISKEKECVRKYTKLLECENSFYRQKFDISWGLHGDKWTQFFHSAMKTKRHQNIILSIYSKNDARITEMPQKISEFIGYYKKPLGIGKFTATPNPNMISNGPVLTSSQCSELSALVTREEIRLALFSMSDIRAPGPDGFNASFFKSTWDIIKEDLFLAVEEFFSSGELLGSLNSTSITLCAFIKGRFILSNFLLAHELIKSYGRKHISPRAMLNVDLRKVFDTISWNFLKDMLTGLGFPNIVICWIMESITSSKFSLSLNGSLHGYFHGARRLRQGDPLSPYLFVFGMEYLSRKLSSLQDDRNYKYHPKCFRLKITHLTFADDLLLFSKADMNSITRLYSCFQEFCQVSGLEANASKCSVYLSGIDESLKN
ncbi:uncharacterized protein LOC109842117 [Asparagus officinalis]|uniref:uncharacterized protein LOC109842117 n=1 Tax=Asparagus officinalis TaxID=4686 RepID=UPI00098E4F07|nr:uncharacterized protein LOC109842117 [Asparagus officinalis]